jgi:TolB-like protein/Tfp pilus assembly protein PilF
MSEDSANQVSVGRDVFVSYASQDVATANALVEHLEQQGIRCWIAPRDVKPGAQYADAIVRAINEATTLVLVLSQSSVGSSHVGREVERAASKHKQVIALKIDAAALTPALEYFLSESQWIDVPALGMPAALARLSEAVGQGAAVAQTNPVFASASGGGSGAPAVNRAVATAIVAKRVMVAAAVVIALGVGGVVVVHFWASKHPEAQTPAAATISDKSIAVLPFADMSEKKDQEYFADGMAEEILDLLAKVPGLHVPARTSSFYFKGKSEDIPTIARRLMVGNVLEGSVRRVGDQVRITVQLVRADNGYHLWSETYDRKVDDVFKVQDDIANEVVKALKVSLGEREVPRMIATKNSDAHALLLQARFFLSRQSEGDLSRAIDNYQQALQLDPNSASAWAELSMALTYTWNSGLLAPNRTFKEQRAQAFQAADRAIAINPTLAEAHEALAEVRYWFDWDWSAAQAEIDKALSIDPSSGLTQAGGMAMLYGKYNDAVRLWKQDNMLDPLNADAHSYLAELHTFLANLRRQWCLPALR